MFFQPYQILNWAVTLGSLILCIWLSLVRIPGLELFGITPNWVLIWLVAWSIKRTLLQAVIGGFACGLILDGLSYAQPSHIIPYITVAILTVLIYKRVITKIQEDFISVALIVFGMAIIVETIRALQFSGHGYATLPGIWLHQQRVALCAGVLSSLWTPVIYLPLSRWWALMEPSNQLKSKV